MIIFDLEWNSGRYDKIRLDEILQIGAVKAARPGAWVEDSFCAFIRPSVHRRYSPAAQVLPELETAKASLLDFPSAAKAFFDWCGQETVFAAWGANDFLALRQNMEFWHLDRTLPETYLDLQAAFGLSIGATNNPSLEWAVEYCKVPDIFDPHNALSDAVYTWAVCSHVSQPQLDAAFRSAPVPGLRHPTASLPKRSTPWHGPFEAVNEALNNRGCRRAECPVCSMRCPVSRWYFRDGGPYYAKFVCPDHGPFLWRLEITSDKKGRLWANGAALIWNAKHRALFQSLKGEASLECHRKRRRRRRRASSSARKEAPSLPRAELD